ncbi:MAG: sulfatase [Planctomycetota bacterium]
MRPTQSIHALFAVLLACAAAFSCPAQTIEQTPPNIVWLSVEDMSPWIGPYGDDTVPTPNLDRLAARGLVYENAFATSPVCAPARSSLITGMYATRIGSMQMRNGRRSRAAGPGEYDGIPAYEAVPPAFVRCFPEHLRAAGYYCTNNSKRDYQFKEPVTVWDQTSNKAHWRNRAEGQPFFAVFNYTGTHESRAFPNRNQGQGELDPGDAPVPPIYPDTPEVRDAMARTYNNIAAMDHWVGQKIEELEEAGLLEQTVVMFFSDHGVGLPRGKRSCYDTGLRVPLIVRFPDGRRAGEREGRVAEFVDFGPTVLSLAGIEPDRRLDGAAFLGEFARDEPGYAFGHGDRFDSIYEQTRTVSDGRYRYTRNLRTDVPYILRVRYREQLPMTADIYALQRTGPQAPEQWQLAATRRPAEEFYDSASDPWEVNNLIDDPRHAARIAEMRQTLGQWIQDTGDLGLILPESKMVAEKLWPPDGVQPTTPAAQIQIATLEAASDHTYAVTITCDQPGASIGYRMSNTQAFNGPWNVYTKGPAPLAGEGFIQVRTHRIGHRPSTVVIQVGPE